MSVTRGQAENLQAKSICICSMHALQKLAHYSLSKYRQEVSDRKITIERIVSVSPTAVGPTLPSIRYPF